jgi:hypothetical protein
MSRDLIDLIVRQGSWIGFGLFDGVFPSSSEYQITKCLQVLTSSPTASSAAVLQAPKPS